MKSNNWGEFWETVICGCCYTQLYAYGLNVPLEVAGGSSIPAAFSQSRGLTCREPYWERKYRFSLNKRATKLFLCERTFQDRDFFPFFEKGVLTFPILAPKGVHEKNENGLKTPLSLHFL